MKGLNMPNKKNDTYEIPKAVTEQLADLMETATRCAEPQLLRASVYDLEDALRYHKARGLVVHKHYLRGELESKVRQSVRAHVDSNNFWTLYNGGRCRYYVLEIDFPWD